MALDESQYESKLLKTLSSNNKTNSNRPWKYNMIQTCQQCIYTILSTTSWIILNRVGLMEEMKTLLWNANALKITVLDNWWMRYRNQMSLNFAFRAVSKFKLADIKANCDNRKVHAVWKGYK